MFSVPVFTFADLLLTVWPRHTAKLAAAATGCPTRTVEGWLHGHAPRADVLLKLAAENAVVRAELVRLLGEMDAQTAPGISTAAPCSLDGEASGSAQPTGEADAAGGSR